MHAQRAWYLAAAVSAVFLFLLWLVRRNRSSPFTDGRALPYRRRALMSPVELSAYALLLDALPDYMVFAQIQASRVLDIPPRRDHYYWFNFVSRLSYDFVVCRTDGTPLAAIEIDDASHERADRQEADHRKDKATSAAGIAMIRWRVGKLPNAAQIQKQIRKIDSQSG